MAYVAANEIGILVAVKTILSVEESEKALSNAEKVGNFMKDHKVQVIMSALTKNIITKDPSKNFNFIIGSYNNNETTAEAILEETSRIKLVMGKFKDWLKNLSKEDENIQEIEREEKPDQDEINFVKEVKEDGPFMIKGMAIDDEGISPIQISSKCFTRMLDTYLEKYGSNS